MSSLTIISSYLRKHSDLQCNSNVSRTGDLRAGHPAVGGFGGLGGEAPSCWAIFYNFLEKKAILMPLNHISHMFRAI